MSSTNTPDAPDAPDGLAPPLERPFVAAGDDDALRFPDSSDLISKLHFSPRDGRISLGRERMVLLHVRALGTLRRALIDALGLTQARALLLRVGYTSGYHDALQSQQIRRDTSLFELLSAGPQLHALEGMASVRPMELRFDRARGEYYGEFMWRNSAEAEAEMMAAGVSPVPTCWLLLGYATGYTSGFMGRPIVYREICCRGCGARHCRIVGRPLETWPEVPEGFEFLRDDAPPPAAAPAPTCTSGPALPDGLVGASPAFVAAWSLIEAVAPTTTAALLHGEIGSGRSTLAAALHGLSARREGPRIALGAGHGDADAVDDAFARAAAGSLLLDDLDAWPTLSQRRLLERLDAAAADERPRMIVTMIRDPEDPAHSELTRRLLFRLGAFPIHLPPLRDRRGDILPLAAALRERLSVRLRKRLPGLSSRAERALVDHDYPGNLHELANLIERAAILVADDEVLDVGHLFGGEARSTSLFRVEGGQLRREDPEADAQAPGVDLDGFVGDALSRGVALDAIEEALIRGAVDRADGNLAAAARTLGLTRAQLAYRFRKLSEDRDA
ncbi:MAG: XylR N-terminal domain-containing protein [Nannocystaceae bacterium]